MKNKILSLIITFVTLFTLTACSTTSTRDNGKLQIVTTLFPQYDFTRAIAGENADITLLLTPGADSHSYEPTAADIAKIQQADLFIYNGGESEIWVKKILDSAGDVEALRLMDYVQPLEAAHEHDEHTEHEEHNAEYDEHIFTSLKNAVIMLEAVNNKICELDSQNADFYHKNAANYGAELQKLDADFEKMISDAKRKKIILADRNPFRYFANDYGLEIHAAFSGCSHDTDASPAVLSELMDEVQKESIPIIFTVDYSSQDMAIKIAEATGAGVTDLCSCHVVSKGDFENGITYLNFMELNYTRLSEALN